MSNEKTILSRIIHKHDIETNWNKAENFIPKQGEIIVYDIDENYNYERFKIGDGNTSIINLPFQKTNINDLKAVSYDMVQSLTDEQKEQARINIGAASEANKPDWNQLTNKPTELAGGDTLTWDGNTDGKANIGGAYFKVSDAVFTYDDLKNGYSFISNGEENTLDQTAVSNLDIAVMLEGGALCVTEDGVGKDISGGMGFIPTESGTYFMWSDDAGLHTSSLTIPNYTGFTTEKLKDSIIPNTVSRVGHTHSFNDLENKPFGETVVYGDTLTWDGNTDGLVSVGDMFYKISDAVPTKEDCANGMIVTFAGEEVSLSGEEAQAAFLDDGLLNASELLFIPTDNYSLTNDSGDSIIIPEAGVYSAYVDGMFVQKIVIPNYTGFTTTETKQLDSRYLEPFNVKKEPFEEIFPEQTVSMNYENHRYNYTSNKINLQVGKTYIVEFDGKEYTYICKFFEAPDLSISFPYIGNIDVLISDGTTDNEQFGIADISENGESASLFSITSNLHGNPSESGEENVEHTFRIYSPEVNETKLKIETLPDGYPYVEKGYGMILPETTVEIDPDSGEGIIVDIFTLTVGNQYIVNWNGTEYTCTAQEVPTEDGITLVALGDIGLMMGGTSTGEPFVVMAFTSDIQTEAGFGGGAYALDGSTTVALSIYEQGGIIVKKIDMMYLPDGYPYKNMEMTEIFPEITVDGRSGSHFIKDVVNIKVGNNYTVKWNGVEYSCIAQPHTYNGAIFGASLGDIGAVTDGISTGEPFVCMFFNAAYAAATGIGGTINILDGSSTATLSIDGMVEVVHPISLEYLEPFEMVEDQSYEEVFPEETVTLANHDGTAYSTSREEKLNLAEGNTYVVEYDGTEYKCECKVYRTLEYPVYYLGNIDILMHQSYTGEPFLIGGGSTEDTTTIAVYKPSDGSRPEFVTHTFRVYAPEIKGGAKLKPECLPNDWLNGNGYVTETELNNKGYLTAVPTEYITETELNNKGYVKKADPTFTGAFTLGTRKTGSVIGGLSFAVGTNISASGMQSHATGSGTTAAGINSHAEGFGSTASGDRSHAEGDNSIASGLVSHVEGLYNEAKGDCQHVQGKFNVANTNLAHIVGNGTSENVRSNAHTLDWDGNAWFQGDIYVGSTSGTNKDEGSVKLIKNGDKELILTSSTEGSTKKFKITIDDNGVLTTKEVTE